MSECEHEWRLRFPELYGTNGPPEYIPLTVTYRNNRRKLDYCKLKFNSDVAENIEKAARHGALRNRQLAELTVDDETVDYFLFDPNKTDFGENYAHVTLKDVQETLDDGTVDMQRHMAVLKDVYTDIFEEADSDFLHDIKFTGGPILSRETYTEGAALPEDYRKGNDRWEEPENPEDKRRQEPINIVESKYVVDIENLSPIEAIWELNEKYDLSAWTDGDRNLWIGTPESSTTRHVCAPDDSRVWRWTNVNIRAPRRPIKRVIVEGAWLDDTNWPTGEYDGAGSDVLGFFDEEGEPGDRRVIGVAERHDIATGTEIVVEDKTAKRDGIAEQAHQRLLEETIDAYQGTVRINPALGGEFTPYTSIRPGDFLHVVPDDKMFESPYTPSTGHLFDDPDRDHEICGNAVNNEVYSVTEVQHNVDDGGHWSISLDVQLYPEELSHADNGGAVHRKMDFKVPNERNYENLQLGDHL